MNKSFLRTLSVLLFLSWSLAHAALPAKEKSSTLHTVLLSAQSSYQKIRNSLSANLKIVAATGGILGVTAFACLAWGKWGKKSLPEAPPSGPAKPPVAKPVSETPQQSRNTRESDDVDEEQEGLSRTGSCAQQHNPEVADTDVGAQSSAQPTQNQNLPVDKDKGSDTKSSGDSNFSDYGTPDNNRSALDETVSPIDSEDATEPLPEIPVAISSNEGVSDLPAYTIDTNPIAQPQMPVAKENSATDAIVEEDRDAVVDTPAQEPDQQPSAISVDEQQPSVTTEVVSPVAQSPSPDSSIVSQLQDAATTPVSAPDNNAIQADLPAGNLETPKLNINLAPDGSQPDSPSSNSEQVPYLPSLDFVIPEGSVSSAEQPFAEPINPQPPLVNTANPGTSISQQIQELNESVQEGSTSKQEAAAMVNAMIFDRSDTKKSEMATDLPDTAEQSSPPALLSVPNLTPDNTPTSPPTKPTNAKPPKVKIPNRASRRRAAKQRGNATKRPTVTDSSIFQKPPANTPINL